MLREEVEQYTMLTGEDGNLVPTIKISTYLDGYNKGLEGLDKIRTKIVKSLCMVTNDYDQGRNYGLRMAVQIIDKYKTMCYISETLDKAIKAVEQTRWISVSDELPKDGEPILIKTKTNGVYEGKYSADDRVFPWYLLRDNAFASSSDVIAWMPMSELYKAESEDMK